MINRKKYLLFGTLFLLSFLIFVFVFPKYSGDGNLVNNGWFRLIGYHYEISFDEIIFKDESIDREYNLSGVPFQTYDFELRIVPIDDLFHDRLPEIQQLYNKLYDSEINIKILLLEDEKQIYELGGKLSSDHWILSDFRFYLLSSEHQFSRYSSYTIQISMQSRKPLEEEVVFQPYLLGGSYRVF